jgi:hypothetical protein
MAVRDGLGDVDDFVAVVLGVLAQHVEGLIGVEGVPGHEDALGLLDRRSASEGASEPVVLSEPLQRDVDRAL